MPSLSVINFFITEWQTGAAPEVTVSRLKRRTATRAHQTRRAVTFSTITFDLWGIFAIDFHRNKPKTIENNNLFKKIDFLKILDVRKALINRRFWCEYYHQGSGSHKIVSILLEIFLTVALHLPTGKAQKSTWVIRKRLNGLRMFIFYTSVTEKSWFHSIRC